LFPGELSDSEVLLEFSLQGGLHLEAPNEVVGVVPEVSPVQVVDVLDGGPLVEAVEAQVNDLLDDLSLGGRSKDGLQVVVRTGNSIGKVVEIFYVSSECMFFVG
jgi:hypothetical protein